MNTIINNERKILEERYFEKIEELSETHQVKGRPCNVRYVSLNNIPYLLYEYDNSNLCLIPASINFCDGNSNGNIYNYNVSDHGFALHVIDIKNYVLKEDTYAMCEGLYSYAKDGLALYKTTLRRLLDPEELQSLVQKYFSAELIFGDRKYETLRKNSAIDDKTGTIVVKANGTTKYLDYILGAINPQEIKDIHTLISNEENYTEVSNDISMVDIADHKNIKELCK